MWYSSKMTERRLYCYKICIVYASIRWFGKHQTQIQFLYKIIYLMHQHWRLNILISIIYSILIIINDSWASNHYILIIPEGSCDALKTHFCTVLQKKTIILNCNGIVQYYCFAVLNEAVVKIIIKNKTKSLILYCMRTCFL